MFSVTGQIVIILGFVDDVVSVMTTQCCRYSHKQYIKEGMWLCFHKILFTKIHNWLNQT